MLHLIRQINSDALHQDLYHRLKFNAAFDVDRKGYPFCFGKSVDLEANEYLIVPINMQDSIEDCVYLSYQEVIHLERFKIKMLSTTIQSIDDVMLSLIFGLVYGELSREFSKEPLTVLFIIFAICVIIVPAAYAVFNKSNTASQNMSKGIEFFILLFSAIFGVSYKAAEGVGYSLLGFISTMSIHAEISAISKGLWVDCLSFDSATWVNILLQRIAPLISFGGIIASLNFLTQFLLKNFSDKPWVAKCTPFFSSVFIFISLKTWAALIFKVFDVIRIKLTLSKTNKIEPLNQVVSES